jgi:hypothetical protein
MRQTLIAVIIFCFCYHTAKPQTSNNGLLTTLLKSQKDYISTNMQEKQKPKYLSLLHFANVIHPKVIDEIQKLNASFPANNQNINILEGFAGYSNVNGIIWQGDSTYYSYNYGADKKLTVTQRSFSQLNDATRIIVQNFANWSNATFATNGQALSAPTDHPFFLASKVLFSSEPTVQTIGFYYQ